MSDTRILFVDDEAEVRRSATEWLTLSGFSVETAADVAEARAKLSRDGADIVVTDIRMPGEDGISLLHHVTESHAGIPVILLTGHGDVSMAVSAMRDGAYDFLEKPYDADHLVAVLRNAGEKSRLSRELARLRAQLAGASGLDNRMIGESDAMRRMKDRLMQLAGHGIDVLIHGETGTGKEVAAHLLHDLGPRAAKPFVAINCAAIPESIFESELFGHAKGAFTGADSAREGRLVYANGGTVFLDEIESMPLGLQTRLLRVIQEREVEVLGHNAPRPLDVRFVAATKSDLKALGEKGEFRSDLYYRLAASELSLPPLRDRGDDVIALFGHFTAEEAARSGLSPRPLPDAVLSALLAHDWPGNVRELKSLATRFSLGLSDGIPGRTEVPEGGAPGLAETMARIESGIIRRALREAGGNQAEAARRLQIPRRTLGEKIDRLGIREDGET
ncbi:sigma-54-dependent transcriptional regulator [Oricola indica]|uniref:sigma-54-dependent transcriptional regulator n=1 Tax=Oricola indica TaxID=2872591 RepID=UPI003CCBAE2D